MNYVPNSAGNQKLGKIYLSDSFSNDFSVDSPRTHQDIEDMLNQLYSALLQAKLLPKSFPRPEATMESLNFLVTTLCDEFLLEVDAPITETHNSSGSFPKKDQRVEDENSEQSEDLLSRIFYTTNSVKLSEKECKDLSAMIIEMARASKSSALQRQQEKLQYKLIEHGQEMIRCKKLLQLKENEIQELRKEVESLYVEREVLTTAPTPDNVRWKIYDKSSEDNE